MGRYQVTGLPPNAARGISAFMPHMNRMAASGAQEYKDGVHGYPGTRAIPIAMTVPPSPDIGDAVLYGPTASRYAPNAIYPNLYWTLPERNYRPGLLVQMYDPTAPELTTHIPVPAVSLRQQYLRKQANEAMGIRPSGAAQIRQPVSQLISWGRRRMSGNGLPNG